MQFRSAFAALAAAFSFGSAFADTVTFDAGTASTSAVSFSGASTAAGISAESGLTLTGLLDSSAYSLSVTFSLSDTDSWRKLVDFQNLSSDLGLYAYSGRLYFATSSDPVYGGEQFTYFSANTPTTLSLSRTVAGLVSVSVNGTEQLSFVDTSGDAVFSTVGGQTVARLLTDDVVTQTEQAVGTISSVSYGATVAAVPEPESVALAAVGLITALGVARRRQRQG